MKIYLRDRNPEMAEAWKHYFAEADDVDISIGDIFVGFDNPVDAIISPANSFGFMDGGIDYIYSLKFGWDMSDRLRKEILAVYGGELLVGSGHIIETGSEDIPWLVCAPTMRVPMDVSQTVNAYLAFRGALYAAKLHNWRAKNKGQVKPINSILCPGLGTAVGHMSYENCAQQMYEAYKQCVKKKIPIYETLGDAYRQHFIMAGCCGQASDAPILMPVEKKEEEEGT